MYYGIKDEMTNEYVIQKSKFITVVSPIEHIEDVRIKIEEVKNKYPSANHYCYAYICDNEKRASDDGEPSGTAGNPILNILENEHLNHVLCIVVRYFGGIKLGAGGLVRAYGTATKLAIALATIGKRIPAFLVESTFCYENSKQINYLLKSSNIISQVFEEVVTYQYIISKEDWNKLQDELTHLSNDTKILSTLFTIK